MINKVENPLLSHEAADRADRLGVPMSELADATLQDRMDCDTEYWNTFACLGPTIADDFGTV